MSAPGVYRAKVVAPFSNGSCTVVIPQLFGEVQVPVRKFVSPLLPLDLPMGWIMFEGGSEDNPVWIGPDTSVTDTQGLQTVTLTGDVTGTGTGSFATTIANNAVTNAKAADVPTATLKGRTTAATGDPEDLTVAQAKTLLNLTGSNTGDQTITLTGAVIGSGTGSFATSIPAGTIVNADVNAAAAIARTKIANPTADVSNGGFKLTNVADPLTAQDAATKNYADLRIPAALVDAKGDILVATANDVVARQAVGTDGQILTSDSTATTGVVWASPWYGRRNLLDNCSNQIFQRGSGASGVSTQAIHSCDRWWMIPNVLGSWNFLSTTKAAFGPLAPGEGGRHPRIMYAQCSTANAAPAAGAYFLANNQRIEGLNCQHLLWGTANAKPVTWSGLVYTSNAGTYYMEIQTASQWQTRPMTLASGWNYTTVTFAGNTGTAIANDSNAGLQILMWGGGGANFDSGTWTGGWSTGGRCPGQVNVAAAVNNIIGFAGWQLEVGTVATPFEYISYDDDFRHCLRHFGRHYSPEAKGYMTGAANAILQRLGMTLNVEMRATPTAAMSGTIYIFDGVQAGSFTTIATSYCTSRFMELDCGGVTLAAGTAGVGRGVGVYNAVGAGYIDLGADI